jgi:hypothetical protein
MLHRCRGHAISHGIGKPLEALGTALADPGDGRGDQLHAEQVGHQRGQTLLGQQLVVQQIEHEGADPRAVLHRRSHPIGKCRPGPCAAGRTTAAVRTVFGDDQRLWIGKVEYPRLRGGRLCLATWSVTIASVSGSPHAAQVGG